MPERLVQAVDGGNSKTEVVLGTAAGDVLAFTRGPGSSPHNLGVPGSMSLLDGLIADARAAAGGPADTEGDQPSVYLAGAHLPIGGERLFTPVETIGRARSLRVDN